MLELLRLDGRGDASDTLCPSCKVQGKRAAYRCRECKGGLLFCKECCVERHLENPLHFVEVSSPLFSYSTTRLDASC